ncbi:Ribonuclease H domain [Senna tora]|uniref:Ribonuclease H domain n=1 Tax=Senna tora TaxID=362788 RepID=A0A834SNK7_9FABA|nr:Ribonuclease H domain [Senna tora]
MHKDPTSLASVNTSEGEIHLKQNLGLYKQDYPLRFLSTFEDYKLTHIYREANGCADILAKHARISQCSKSTFLEPPLFLRPQLLKDSMHIESARYIRFQPH